MGEDTLTIVPLAETTLSLWDALTRLEAGLWRGDTDAVTAANALENLLSSHGFSSLADALDEVRREGIPTLG